MDFKFPDVGEGIAEGVLVKWLVKEGDTIKVDQPVCEVETDKAVVEIPSPASGSVQKLFWKQGDTVPVGKVLMTIGDGTRAQSNTSQNTTSSTQTEPTKEARSPQNTSQSQSIAQPTTNTSTVNNQSSTNTTVIATPALRHLANIKNIDLKSIRGSGPQGRIILADLQGGSQVQKPQPAQSQNQAPQSIQPASFEDDGPHTIIAAPSTRRLARELGVDIKQIRGTGEAGKITDDDVRSFKNQPAKQSKELPPDVLCKEPTGLKQSAKDEILCKQPTAGNTTSSTNQTITQPLSGLRKAIAKHLSVATHTMAQATHMESVDVTNLVQIRSSLKETAEKNGIKLTYLPFIVKALVSALQKFPSCNASLDEATQTLQIKQFYNIGIAVDTPEGLVVPVIKNAETKSIAQIASEIVQLASQAKERKLSPDAMRGGTCSITNIGVLGGEFFVPIVNYPEVLILGICKIKDAAVVKDGQIVVRKILNLSISYDHRVVDGADVARFCNHLCARLENPDLLLLE